MGGCGDGGKEGKIVKIHVLIRASAKVGTKS